MHSTSDMDNSTSTSSNKSLDEVEKVLLDEIAKDNQLMRRKLKHDTLRHTGKSKKDKKSRSTEKSVKKSSSVSSSSPKSQSSKSSKSPRSSSPKVRSPLAVKTSPSSPKRQHSPKNLAVKSPVVAKKSPNSPAPVAKQASDEEMRVMKQRLAELERMQDMYKNRINELEEQVSTFSVFHALNNPIIQQVMDNKKAEDAKKKPNQPTGALPPLPQSDSLFDGHKKKSTTMIPTGSIALDIPVASIQSKFLDHFSQMPKIKKTDSTDFVIKPKLLALYDFSTDVSGRLSFFEGDILFLRKKSSSGWWTAELNGKVGKIPSNHVESLDASKSFRVRAVKDYKASQSGDLALRRGEILTILKKQDNGWWLGERSGKTGFFPSKNVEKIVVNNPDA